MTVEHHRAHALCATLLVPWDEEVLVFSCDGEGDNLSATVSILHRGKIQRIAQTSAEDSLGILYLKVTEYLGGTANAYQIRTYLASLRHTGLPADVSKYKASTT